MRVSSSSLLRPTEDAAAALLVIAATLLASVTRPEVTPLFGVLAAGAVVVIVASALLRPQERSPHTSDARATRLLIAVVFGLVLAAALAVAEAGIVFVLLVGLPGSGLLWLLWRAGEPGPSWAIVALALTVLAAVAIVGLVMLSKPAVDVVLVNEAGAEALAAGENPYVTVVVPNTNPYLEEAETFDGYVYPPLALVTYSVSEWLTGDTRWVNVVAVGALVLMLIRFGFGREESTARYAVLAALAIVALPTLALLFRWGWTEPIALPFLAGAAFIWRRHPVASAVLLGLALASKQYFVLLAPLLIAWDGEFRWRRVAIAGGVVVATVLPFAASDPQAFWDAVVAPSLSAAPRPDSANLIALGFEPPSWLAAVLASVVGLVLGRRGGEGAAFTSAVAAVLGVAFLFGFQAFSNYWFLVFGLCLTAAVVGIAEREAQRAATATRVHAGAA